MAKQETVVEIKELVGTLFDVAASSLGEATKCEDVPGWDSMGQLTVILEVEQQFGIEITPEQGLRMDSIGAIAELVDEAQAAGGALARR